MRFSVSSSFFSTSLELPHTSLSQKPWREEPVFSDGEGSAGLTALTSYSVAGCDPFNLWKTFVQLGAFLPH